jgi:hypothetical protein
MIQNMQFNFVNLLYMKKTQSCFSVFKFAFISVLVILIVLLTFYLSKKKLLENFEPNDNDTTIKYGNVGVGPPGSPGARGPPGEPANINHLNNLLQEEKEHNLENHSSIEGTFIPIKTKITSAMDKLENIEENIDSIYPTYLVIKKKVDDIYFSKTPYCFDKKQGESISTDTLDIINECDIDKEKITTHNGKNVFKYDVHVSECLDKCGKCDKCNGFVDNYSGDTAFCEFKNLNGNNNYISATDSDTYIIQDCGSPSQSTAVPSTSVFESLPSTSVFESLPSTSVFNDGIPSTSVAEYDYGGYDFS